VGLLTGLVARVNLSVMSRALAVFAAGLLFCRVARADQVDQTVRELSVGSSKVRLAATLALSKSKDARAVLAVSGALNNDTDPTIRRVSRNLRRGRRDHRRARALAGILERAARRPIPR
jgi:hypothetical protein